MLLLKPSFGWAFFVVADPGGLDKAPLLRAQ
jgi:hypothetical protein